MNETKRQLPIYEVRTPDGGVGIMVGDDGAVCRGYDAQDLLDVLREWLPDVGSLDPQEV